jgi:MoaA/NifB/PqqE/SkfB family radical SAM enzyme
MKYEKYDKLYLYYEDIIMRGNSIGLILGTKCQCNCAHCFEKTSIDSNSTMSNEIIDKAFEFIEQTGEKDYVIDILGGETLLYPELCKKICKTANERGIITEITTNGWLGDDDEAINFLINEIKPTFLNISVDEYHQEFIPIKTVQKFVDKVYEFMPILINYCSDLQNGPLKNLGKIERASIIQKKMREYFPNKELYFYMEEIIEIGNAKKNKIGRSSDMLKSACQYYCVVNGILINYNGEMVKKCFLHLDVLDKCKLGNVFKITNFKNILTEYKKTIKSRTEPDLRFRKIRGFMNND